MTSPTPVPVPSWATWLTTIGLLLVAAGAVLPVIFGLQALPYKIVFSAGAVTSLIGRLCSVYKGPNMVVKRLTRIEAWSSMCFCVAAFFMWYSNAGRDWVAFTLAGGILMLYTSIRIPRELKKDQTPD